MQKFKKIPNKFWSVIMHYLATQELCGPANQKQPFIHSWNDVSEALCVK